MQGGGRGRSVVLPAWMTAKGPGGGMSAVAAPASDSGDRRGKRTGRGRSPSPPSRYEGSRDGGGRHDHRPYDQYSHPDAYGAPHQPRSGASRDYSPPVPRDYSPPLSREYSPPIAQARQQYSSDYGKPGPAAPMANPATLVARRVAVAGVDGLREDDLRGFIHSLFGTHRHSEADPIVDVTFSSGYAYVELTTMELAQALCNLGVVMFGQRPLKFVRPSDYDALSFPPLGPVPNLGMPAPPPQMPPPPMVPPGAGVRLAFSGAPPTYAEADLKLTFERVGPVKYVFLEREPSTKVSKGYGYFEFVDPASVSRGLSQLPGFNFGSNYVLNVQPMAAHVAAGVAVPMAPAVPGSGIDLAAFMGNLVTAVQQSQKQGSFQPPAAPAAVYPQPQAAPPGYNGARPPETTVAPQAVPVARTAQPTRVVMLNNVVNVGVLGDEYEFRQLRDEVLREARSAGKVLECVIPRPPAPGQGRIFLLFDSLDGARDAVRKFNNRSFDGRIVSCAFYDESSFEKKDLVR